ncbi:hypothetical protein MO767_11880 [Pseudomonas sp. UYIF39]|uniref:hypothetical protein n=1 Tax=Pseudomonas sp. UYIF39 TaxID=1630747 RepID=UPI00249E5525|nr:hypothetical protein [Pseudomonas sp. UYIF39]MDI3355046.1 hypothetical protein [Pseudomonas sp. UYIF39]
MNIDANACKVCEGDELFLHLLKEHRASACWRASTSPTKAASSLLPATPSTLWDAYVHHRDAGNADCSG